MFSSSSSAAASSAAPALLARSAVLLPRQEHRNTIIFMHGLGDSSDGFRGLFESMSEKSPFTKVILPNAEKRPVSVNGGMRMPAWYDLYSIDKTINSREDSEGIEKSRKEILALIDHEVEGPLHGNSTALIVGGFSQGAAMAVVTGLTSSRPLGGIVALSGYLLLRDTIQSKFSPHAWTTPMLAYHGKDDEVVPFDIAKLSWGKLKEMGCQKVKFLAEKDLGHSLSNDELKHLNAFFTERFEAAAASSSFSSPSSSSASTTELR